MSVSPSRTPRTPAADPGPMIGLWLALTACVLMLAGVAMSVARVSVAIRIHDGDRRPPAPGQAGATAVPPGGPDPAGTEATSVMASEPGPVAPDSPPRPRSPVTEALEQPPGHRLGE